ncbi:MAG: M23 family metallopeptidase [Frankiales bacterium]|nr:M23 family metallopeptidase [Frankiales bacterium]
MTPDRRFRVPANGPAAPGGRRVAPPVVLGSVAAFVAALLVTGHHASTQIRSVASVRPVSLGAVLPDAPGTTRTSVDVSQALSALAPGSSTNRVAPVSRTEQRLSLHRWVRPNGGPLTSPYGMRWGRMHEGIDLAGPYGSPILAATAGCITYAGPMAGYGEVMRISDWDGTETVYGHMSAFVRHSGCVKPGDVIARVGSGGDATGPHLHFEVRVGGNAVDPIPFLAKRGLSI